MRNNRTLLPLVGRIQKLKLSGRYAPSTSPFCQPNTKHLHTNEKLVSVLVIANQQLAHVRSIGRFTKAFENDTFSLV